MCLSDFVKTLFLFPQIFFLVLLSSTGIASDFNDQSCFQLSKDLVLNDSEKFKQRLSERYPDLSFILNDIPKFKKEMNQRFQSQKDLTPEAPYSFDYSELGLPVILSMKKDLETFLREERNISDRHLEALKMLLEQVTKIHQTGKVSYIDTYRYSVYFSRIIGFNDTRKLGIIDRLNLWHDRLAQGYTERRMEEVIQWMKDNDVLFFEKESIVGNFNTAAEKFSAAFSNPDQLETIILPTHLDLGLNIMYQLLPHNIHVLGVTPRPIAADGFLRPSGDFFMHDLRHSSLIFYKLKTYFKINNVDEEQQKALSQLSDDIIPILLKRIRKVEDNSLRHSLMLLSFNFHHEQGLPLLPSSFKNPTGGIMPYLSYIVKRISGQDPKFRNPKKNISKAYQWLKDFWAEYEEMETEILGSQAIYINTGKLNLN